MMKLSVLFILMSIHHSNTLFYYISSDPIHNETCTANGSTLLRPCYSFNQLITNKTLLSDKLSVTLLLLSEKYAITQDSNFTVSNVENLEFRPWDEHKVVIECQWPGELVFLDVVGLTISSLNFFTCTLRYLLDLSLAISFPADVAIRECIFAANPFNYAVIFKTVISQQV